MGWVIWILIRLYDKVLGIRPSYRKMTGGGGAKSTFQKNEGRGDYLCVLAHGHLGGSLGACPKESFVFRLSYIASGAFLGTVVSVSGLLL